MKIYFNIDEYGYVTKEYFTKNSNAQKIIETVQSFVETRLKPLIDEIDNEPEGRILIDIGKPEIKYYFSRPLALKMMESISEDDFKYIMTTIYFNLNQQ